MFVVTVKFLPYFSFLLLLATLDFGGKCIFFYCHWDIETWKHVIRSRLCLAVFLKSQLLLDSWRTLLCHYMFIHWSSTQTQIYDCHFTNYTGMIILKSLGLRHSCEGFVRPAGALLFFTFAKTNHSSGHSVEFATSYVWVCDCKYLRVLFLSFFRLVNA